MTSAVAAVFAAVIAPRKVQLLAAAVQVETFASSKGRHLCRSGQKQAREDGEQRKFNGCDFFHCFFHFFILTL